MQHYGNRSGKSGVYGFESGSGVLDVQFTTGAVYRYTDSSDGAAVVREMTRLAHHGFGLQSYINSNHIQGRKLR